MILFLGLVITFLLPLKLTVEHYGYWQLYFFYSGFVGLLMFGMSDGIHLKYAGKNYQDLDKKKFRLFFRFTIYLSLLMFIVISLLIFTFVNDPDRVFALFFISLNIITFNLNGFFLHINQITSRFKYYSWGIVLDRLIFVFTIIPMFFLPFDSYKYYILVNIVSRFVVVIYNIYISSDVVLGEALPLKDNYREIFETMKIGIPLTISAILSMLLVSYPRLIIDNYFGIEEFGAFSLANSMLSIAVQLVIAVSTVIYPLLKNTKKNEYELIINMLNSSVWIFGSIMLCAYFPIAFLLKSYLPGYTPILDYLYFLFPMMIYQCKNNIVITTFYKTLRFEKKMLINNIGGLLINMVITIVSYFLFESILSIVVASVVCYAVWTYFTDWYLKKKCNWSLTKYYLDFFIILSFLLSTQIQNWIIGLLVYLISLIYIAIIFRSLLLEWFGLVLSILRNKKEKY